MVEPNTGKVDYNGQFRPISRYVSETVQDRDIVSRLWKTNRNSYALY